MEKVNQEVEKLIDMIEEMELVKTYQQAKEEVRSNKEVMKLIKRYQEGEKQLRDVLLKKGIYSSYHDKSMQLSFLIWGINLKFKGLKGEHICGLSKENIKEEF